MLAYSPVVLLLYRQTATSWILLYWLTLSVSHARQCTQHLPLLPSHLQLDAVTPLWDEEAEASVLRHCHGDKASMWQGRNLNTEQSLTPLYFFLYAFFPGRDSHWLPVALGILNSQSTFSSSPFSGYLSHPWIEVTFSSLSIPCMLLAAFAL